MLYTNRLVSVSLSSSIPFNAPPSFQMKCMLRPRYINYVSCCLAPPGPPLAPHVVSPRLNSSVAVYIVRRWVHCSHTIVNSRPGLPSGRVRVCRGCAKLKLEIKTLYESTRCEDTVESVRWTRIIESDCTQRVRPHLWVGSHLWIRIAPESDRTFELHFWVGIIGSNLGVGSQRRTFQFPQF